MICRFDVIGDTVIQKGIGSIAPPINSLEKLQENIINNNLRRGEPGQEQDIAVCKITREPHDAAKVAERERLQKILKQNIYSKDTKGNPHQEAKRRLCEIVREFTKPKKLEADQNDHCVMTIDSVTLEKLIGE